MNDFTTIPDYGLSWLEASGDHADPVQPQVAQLCLGIPIGIERNYGQAP